MLSSNDGVQYELIKLRDDPWSKLYGLSNGKMIEWFGRTDEKPEEIHFLDENNVAYHKCKTQNSVIHLDILGNSIFTLERENYPSLAMRSVMSLVNETNDKVYIPEYTEMDFIEWTKYRVRKYDDINENGETVIEFSYINCPNHMLVNSSSIYLLYLLSLIVGYNEDSNSILFLLKNRQWFLAMN